MRSEKISILAICYTKLIIMKNLILVFTIFLISITVTAQNDTINDPQNMLVNIDQEAHYPGGDMEMFQLMYMNIKWPNIKIGVIDDYVTVSFNVLTDSTVTDVEVMKSIDPQIDKAITDFLKTLKFAPSIQLGTPVKMNLMMNIPVRRRFE